MVTSPGLEETDSTDGPETEYSFPNYLVIVNSVKTTAVFTDTPVVAQHIEFSMLYEGLMEIAGLAFLRLEVGFVQTVVVHKYGAVVKDHFLAAGGGRCIFLAGSDWPGACTLGTRCNYPLYIALVFFDLAVKNDDITLVNGIESTKEGQAADFVGEFQDQNTFLVFQGRIHGGALYFVTPYDKTL